MGRHDDFYRDQERRYEDFREDLEYDRRRGEQARSEGWAAARRHDTLWALRGLGGVDLALRYADMGARSATRADRGEASSEREARQLYRVDEVTLYESGAGSRGARKEPQSKFQRHETRYVNTRVSVRNPWFVATMPIDVTFRYFAPSGALMGECMRHLSVPASQRVFVAQAAWGFDEFGHWREGAYRVDVLIDGATAASRLFEIVDSTRFASLMSY